MFLRLVELELGVLVLLDLLVTRASVAGKESAKLMTTAAWTRPVVTTTVLILVYQELVLRQTSAGSWYTDPSVDSTMIPQTPSQSTTL